MTNDTTRSAGDKVSQEKTQQDYAKLKDILDHAYNQAALGKGKVRHANDKAFDRQPILEIGRMVGTGYATGQVMKKAQEANSMVGRGEHEAAIAELLGVIVYAASAVLLIKEYADEARSSTAITLPRAAALQAVSASLEPSHLTPEQVKDRAQAAVRPSIASRV